MAQPFADTEGFVPGYGNLHPRMILVGEAPGATEVPLGTPFTGRAGVKLDLMLDALGLLRQDVFITMSFHRRPTRLRADGKRVNRAPSQTEQLAEGWLLDAELAALPDVPLLAMGNVAIARLDTGRVSDWHGQVRRIRRRIVVDGQLQAGPPARLAVCAHPAALLYRQATQVQTLADLHAIKLTLEVNNCNQ